MHKNLEPKDSRYSCYMTTRNKALCNVAQSAYNDGTRQVLNKYLLNKRIHVAIYDLLYFWQEID